MSLTTLPAVGFTVSMRAVLSCAHTLLLTLVTRTCSSRWVFESGRPTSSIFRSGVGSAARTAVLAGPPASSTSASATPPGLRKRLMICLSFMHSRAGAGCADEPVYASGERPGISGIPDLCRQSGTIQRSESPAGPAPLDFGWDQSLLG